MTISPSDRSVHRVGLVSPAWPPGSLSNGILTYVAGLRLGLGSSGTKSTVIANRVLAPIAVADAPDVLDASAFPPSLPMRALWKARERFWGEQTSARRLGYAVSKALRAAHARAPLDLFEMEESFGAARFAMGAIPRPMVVRLHGPWCLVSPALGLPDDEAFHRRVAFEGNAIRGAHAVSSPSRYALEQVRRHYGIALPHAEVVPNPVVPVPVERRWRYEGCDKKTVLFVGRFDRLKGGDIVLEAFRHLVSEVPEAELVFVGPDRGLRDDAGRTWSFDDYVRGHLPPAVSSRIRTVGEQPPAAIGELRRSSFATLVASRFETFSMTAVEALASGSPLVAPAAAAIVEIVSHGKNGLLFAPADAADSARQLIALFRDPGLASRLGAAGAEDATRRFAPEAVARQMSTFYENVCARARSHRRA